eukprot:10739692-Alexandrium_andersonii.AAC.1
MSGGRAGSYENAPPGSAAPVTSVASGHPHAREARGVPRPLLPAGPALRLVSGGGPRPCSGVPCEEGRLHSAPDSRAPGRSPRGPLPGP